MIKQEVLSIISTNITESRATNRSILASYLYEYEDRSCNKSTENNKKNIDMSTLKKQAIPELIFSWEYNMNELEFE
ncbi:MAG: hypothetical protein EBX50_06780 [Chitinophagia bacterium]|nr:hypothetical protein [Chitinophagia bacterium]